MSALAPSWQWVHVFPASTASMGASVNHIEDPRMFKEPLIKSEVPVVQGHAAKTDNCRKLGHNPGFSPFS